MRRRKILSCVSVMRRERASSGCTCRIDGPPDPTQIEQDSPAGQDEAAFSEAEALDLDDLDL